ncbi:hypothetical protein ACIBHX_47470 [Nonomuraea sp. NPDC050536]|uniref:hypothetical protein n=1 Tax=Nonomuraea sp. NPDC050536 TaxID=3364366 RepID=UPI0037CA0B5A
MAELDAGSELSPEFDQQMENALKLAKSVKKAVSEDDADLEGHSFEDEDIVGQNNVSFNGGCACG